MIRINLIAARKVRRRDAGERHLAFMGLSVLGAVAVMVFMYLSSGSRLDAITRDNDGVRADIDRMKSELGDYDKIKEQRQDLLKQQKTIQALQAGRTGPLFLMREMSEILTPAKGPSFDRASYEERLRRDPNIGFNTSWDTRRVWLDTFEEAQGKVRIQGSAKTNEDVAEFLKRLQLSIFFSEVSPESTQQVGETTLGGSLSVKHVTFNLTARILY
ncbi:MAG TPA: PilN domain-containing protein [Polyangia bacterium]|nr:PilN domain-containing protein [Polyangia bacterium]